VAHGAPEAARFVPLGPEPVPHSVQPVRRPALPEQVPRPERAMHLASECLEAAPCVPAEAVSRFRQPAESSLRLPPPAVRSEEQPAGPAWVLPVQHPAAACRIPEAGPSANPVQSAVQPLKALLAPWSALPSEPALRGVPEAVRRRAATWVSVPYAAEAPPTEAGEAVCSDVQVQPPGVAAVALEPLAQPRVAAAEEPLARQRVVAAPRASAEGAVRLQAAAGWAAAVQRRAAEGPADAVAAVRPQAVAALPAVEAAGRLRAEDPSRAELPSPVAASTCPQARHWDRPAPARSARFAPAMARLRIASP
jgi:hypothetical protein